LSAISVSSLQRFGAIDLGGAQAAAQRVVMREQPLDLGHQRVGSARSQTRMARRPTLSS
jgi:hypothetical protein